MENISKLEKIKAWFSGIKKRNIIIAVIVVVIVLVLVINKNQTQIEFTATPTTGTLSQTVKATGRVVSKTELSLSFEKQGVIKSVNADVGDKVRRGQVLATLDSSSEYAKLLDARASVAASEARLNKVLEGFSNEEINLAKVLLENARRDYENTKITQETNVSNAYRKMLNSTLSATAVSQVSGVTAPTISGVYNLDQEGGIKISVYNTGTGLDFSVSGLVDGVGSVSTITPQPVGDTGLYIVFSSTTNLSGSEWMIDIPNTKASDYVTNKNAYEASLRTRESAISTAFALVNQREAELAIKQAQVKNTDIDLAEADVLSAKARLQEAQTNYEKTVLRAPSEGTITKVDVKYGQLSELQKSAFVLEDVSNLYVESEINESNIVKISLDQKVDITFDALGMDRKFAGHVSHIDPSSDTKDGVVNYVIKVILDEQDPNIRPGMNAEISILSSQKENVLIIPKAGVMEEGGKSYVKVVRGDKKQTLEKVEVVLGDTGDGNMVEVISGLSVSDTIEVSEEE